MIIALWIVNAILALVFISVGLMKMFRRQEKLAAVGLTWTTDVSGSTVIAVGAVEFLGGLGLVLPLATGIAPVLTPLASVGLVLTMAGAILLHARRHESFAAPAVLLVIAAASAVLGFMQV